MSNIKYQIFQGKKGFTLIELLIVIAIIGILSGVLISILNPVFFMGKARDARRKAILADIGKAAEAYYGEIGRYPPAAAQVTPYLKGGVWPSNDPKTGDAYTAVYDVANGLTFCVSTPFESPVATWRYSSSNGKVEQASCT